MVDGFEYGDKRQGIHNSDVLSHKPVSKPLGPTPPGGGGHGFTKVVVVAVSNVDGRELSALRV